jgi:hypothetical protein
MMYEFVHVNEKKYLSQEQANNFLSDPNEIYASGFWCCSDEYLHLAETELGYPLPVELRAWYLEVGVCQITPTTRPTFMSDNNILIPTHIPKLISHTCEWMMPYTQIEPDTLPFFERDVDLFLCLHPHSDNPNAVYWMWGEKMPNGGKICDSLVEFFQRLVEDPDWFNPPKP